MINNRNLIEPLLLFPNGDSFYFVQILQRKKDHKEARLGGANNNSRLIKAYYIRAKEELEMYWEEMVKLAEVFNARVSINLNPRNFRKAAFQTLQIIADQMANDIYTHVHKAYNHVCGRYHSEMDKRWIVDIDTQDKEVVDSIQTTITRLHEKVNNKDYNILSLVPSKSGVHIITNPFNLFEFSQIHPDIEVHKNNPTNLYIP